MHWKRRENNVKNSINIDLKCLIDLASRMESSKLFSSAKDLNELEKQYSTKWLFWKFPENF